MRTLPLITLWKLGMANKTDDIRRLTDGMRGSIGAEEWKMLREAFPKLGESRLRKTLLDNGLKLEQPCRGVDIHSLECLEETLNDLAEFYNREPAIARKMVIAAKDKARFAARNQKAAPEKRALKLEMVDWMLVWLGDPAMFAPWVYLRKQRMTNPTKRSQP